MTTPGIETIIKSYIEQKERSQVCGRKKLDAEKEYNRLLTRYEGDAKNYSLHHANKVYATYQEMINWDAEAEEATKQFRETEEKLREIGQILFEATINAEISVAANPGEIPSMRLVTVSYQNGQVFVN